MPRPPVGGAVGGSAEDRSEDFPSGRVQVAMDRPGGYRALLSNRRFLLFEASASASSVGYSIFALSVPWLALTLSGSFVVVGLSLFAEFGVYAMTFLIAPLVDRAADKRSVFLVCFPLQAVAAAALGGAILERTLSVPLLLGLILLISFLWDFVWAAQSVAPKILLGPDELFRGSGLGGLMGGATGIVGFLVGGALLVVLGPSGGMLLYSGLLVGAALLALPVALPTPSSAASAGYASEFREGWKYFRRRGERSLLGMGSIEVLRGFFAAAPALLITLLATRTYGMSSGAYSVVFIAWAIGGIAIGLVLGELNPRSRIGTILLAAAVAEGALILFAVALPGPLVLTAVLWALIGLSGTAYLTAQYTFLRGAFPAEALGRITSNLYVFTGVSAAVGALLLGQLAQAGTLEELGVLVGAGFLVVGALVLLVPSVRRLAF